MQAQWSTNPAINTPVYSTYTGEQSEQRIIEDGSGGVIICWQDYRGGNWNIYAQRLSAAGMPLWTPNGVVVCSTVNTQWHPSIISDGAGGAFIAWEDYRLSASGSNIDIYAQRINALGIVQWVANGLAVCTQTSAQYFPRLVSDGGTGGIVLWGDVRNGSYDIYAQRLNASGIAQWATNGVAITTAPNSQLSITTVQDGTGGAIVAWEDYRNAAGQDIYAQRINGSGVVQWTGNGVVICNASGNQYVPVSVSDGSGGAIIAWPDGNSGTVSAGVYAQRINSSGAVQWTPNGVGVTNVNGAKSYTSICSDGAGGAILSWEDYRNGSGNNDIYAQRFSGAGTRLWAGSAVPVCNASNVQNTTTMCADGSGGAIIAWRDFRANGFYYDLYSQRVNSTGLIQWSTDGILTSNSFGQKEYPHVVSDAAGGGIVCWDDKRNGTFNPFAQKICSAGLLGSCPQPEINIQGNGMNIVSGDVTPSNGDHTNFGNVIIPNSFSRTFSIQNTGSANLIISSISLAGADAAQFTVGSNPGTILIGASATFTIMFSSANAITGLKSAIVSIQNNDTDESTYTFAIQANAACLSPDFPSITASSVNNCGAISTTLSIASGALNSASVWVWYKDSCGGLPIDSGNSITVSPAQTTTYYVRGEGACVTPGACASMSIQVAPCQYTLQLKAIIEGYYESSGLMKPVLFNQGMSNNQTVCDAILVELHQALHPFSLVASASALMNSNGTFSCSFTLFSGSYYVVLKHRNGIETWSAQPLTFDGATINYDFSSAAGQAYGNNLKLIDTGIWAIFTGDLNQDENIDLLDIVNLESDIANYYNGFFATDIKGDGNVDLLDYPIMELNTLNFISSHHP